MKIDISKSLNYLPELVIERAIRVLTLIETELFFSLEDVNNEIIRDVDIRINGEQFSKQGLTEDDIENVFLLIWKEIPLIDYKFIPRSNGKDSYVKIHITNSDLTYLMEFKKALKRATTEKDNKVSKPEYKDGILYFLDKKIDFNKKYHQKEMLDIIFKEPLEGWFYYDKMLEEWDDLKKMNLIKLPKLYWKKFDSAGDSINDEIAIETGIKDFIKKDSKKIRINPRYLPTST